MFTWWSIMKYKLVGLILIILILWAIILSGRDKADSQQEDIIMGINTNKKVVLIIANEGFQDVEYNETKKVLDLAGIDVVIASSSKNDAIGKFGKRVAIDIKINELNVKEFDAIIFIGGPGAREYINSQSAHNLALTAVRENKVLGAICIAPAILAKAGVLNGKMATVWSDQFDKTTIEILENQGAEYVDKAIVVDGNLITANGPDAALEFGQAIVKLINQ